MGFDKQFLEVNKKLLMENLICELKKEFQDIIIVTNKLEEYKNSKCRIFNDEIKNMFINLNTREDLQRFEKSNKVEDKKWLTCTEEK